METIKFQIGYFGNIWPILSPSQEERKCCRSKWRMTMIEKREFKELAHVDHEWLQARHHFSFG